MRERGDLAAARWLGEKSGAIDALPKTRASA